MKIAIRIIVVILLALVIVWLFDPTLLVERRARKRVQALWSEKYHIESGYSWQWKCFDDLGKLVKRGHHTLAREIFDEAYSLKSPEFRLPDSRAVNQALDISANILRMLPVNAVFITGSSDDTYPFWFIQISEGIRPDILIICRNLWNAPKYRKHIWKTTAVGDVITEDELKSLDSYVKKNQKFVDLSLVVHKLAKKYPVFFAGYNKKIHEFPEDSLCIMPINACMYRSKPMPDSVLSELRFVMLFKQNWNLIFENPPFETKELYRNTGAYNLNSTLINTASSIHDAGHDSLAQLLLVRFGPWLEWDPFYLLKRVYLSEKFGDSPEKWIKRTENWLEQNENHWAVNDIIKFLPQVKAHVDLHPEKKPESDEAMKLKRKPKIRKTK